MDELIIACGAVVAGGVELYVRDALPVHVVFDHQRFLRPQVEQRHQAPRGPHRAAETRVIKPHRRQLLPSLHRFKRKI